jgi:hypothetical protein
MKNQLYKKGKSNLIEKIPFTHYLIFGFLLSAFGFMPGCKKFVEIPPPTSQLVTASVFNNNASASSALTVIYAQMFGLQSSTMALSTGLLGDELTSNASSGTNFQEYTNAMISTGTYGPWNNNAYNYIYQANVIIAGLQSNTGVSPAVKQQLTGEAYFIRAFWHFYLTNCYGDVPLVTTTNYAVNDVLARTPRVQVLQQVVADLKTAQGMLNTNYVDVSDTITTTERTQPNQAAATALLARAYLYLGDYSNQNATDYGNAYTAASAVIGNSAYSLCSNLSGPNSVFLKNSSEAIWQLATPLPATNNTNDGALFILLAAPGSNNFTISTQLLNAFEPNDQRKTNWIGSITVGGKTYYFPYKYKVQTGGTTITEYTMVMRLAEQYLIRAEAQAHGAGHGIAGAIADLNVIRTRAGLPPTTVTTSSTQAQVLAAILHERQVELFTEWGHRWFDLNRTGNTNAVMSVVSPSKGGTWSSDGHQMLFPIPINELTLDSHLTQNHGY